MTASGKVTAGHLSRSAVVYVRQSTLAQTRVNTESLERQYELIERAVEFGWTPEQVRVIDVDLGLSGAESTDRGGFKALVADVALGNIGIVVGIEVSRLARNNADWYQLLDLCGHSGTLIADSDGIYDPTDYSDRLVLGLKGTISEAELHLLRGRLIAGARHKASKGELRLKLPAGYEYSLDDKVVLSSDEAVRAAVEAVFARFAELRSARAVVLSLLGDGLELPRRRRGNRVEWRPAHFAAVYSMLINPVYAGAFAYGRTAAIPPGAQHRYRRQLPIEQWGVCIRDHHPGYITFECYEANLAQLQHNAPAPNKGAAAREGSALCQGLVRCGRCGRMMHTVYRAGTPS